LRRALRARTRPDDDRGAITFIVAAMLVVMIGLSALVVDRGMAADSRRQAQSAADAAVLAAAVKLNGGGTTVDADAAARDYARVNFGVQAADWANCPAPPSGYTALNGSDCITQNTTTGSVRVTLPQRRIPSVFAGLLGYQNINVSAGAEAGVGRTTPPDEVRPDVGWDRMSSVDGDEDARPGTAGDAAPTEHEIEPRDPDEGAASPPPGPPG
jgi:uncharacterized membrane protein